MKMLISIEFLHNFILHRLFNTVHSFKTVTCLTLALNFAGQYKLLGTILGRTFYKCTY